MEKDLGNLLLSPTEPTMTNRHTHHPMRIKAMIVNSIRTKFRIMTPMLPCIGKGPLSTTPTQDQKENEPTRDTWTKAVIIQGLDVYIGI